MIQEPYTSRDLIRKLVARVYKTTVKDIHLSTCLMFAQVEELNRLFGKRLFSESEIEAERRHRVTVVSVETVVERVDRLLAKFWLGL